MTTILSVTVVGKALFVSRFRFDGWLTTSHENGQAPFIQEQFLFKQVSQEKRWRLLHYISLLSGSNLFHA